MGRGVKIPRSVILALLLAVPGVSSGQQLNGEDVWLSKPTIADLPWPKPAPAGFVRYSCHVTAQGQLEACTLLDARPGEAGEATASLLPLFRLSPDAQHTFASDGAVVVVMQWTPSNTGDGRPKDFSGYIPQPQPQPPPKSSP